MSASVLATPPDDVNGIAELWTMAAIVFLVFYSNYVVAPLFPRSLAHLEFTPTISNG